MADWRSVDLPGIQASVNVSVDLLELSREEHLLYKPVGFELELGFEKGIFRESPAESVQGPL